MTFLIRLKIIVLVIAIGALFCLNVSAEMPKETANYGMNPNQPFSPGDWIDKYGYYIEEVGGGTEECRIVYKGIEENNIIFELITEIEGDERVNTGVETKFFKLSLDGNRQTFLNVLSDEKSTFLLTVIDSKNRITLQRTATRKDVPIRFMPDIQHLVAYYSDDFKTNNPTLVNQINSSQTFSDVIKAIGNDENAYNARGIASAQQGNAAQAIADFTKAVELNPNFAGAYNNRSNVYLDQGNIPQAISDLNKAIEIDPKYAGAYYSRASAYVKQGNFSQAVSDCNKSIKLDPNYPSSYEVRASAYLGEKDYEKAWADMHKAEAMGYKPDKEDLEFLDKLKKASGREK